jgi:uncharacterized protein with NRDE domain
MIIIFLFVMFSLIASNRDERFSRSSDRIHPWHSSSVVGGRDSKESGTWLGISKTGDDKNFMFYLRAYFDVGLFSAVTNNRQSKIPPLYINKVSRGNLISEFFNISAEEEDGKMAKRDEFIDDYMRDFLLRHTDHLYNGFSLLLGALKDPINDIRIIHHPLHSSHKPLSESSNYYTIKQGELFIMCNGDMFSNWNKVTHGREKLSKILHDKVKSMLFYV